MMSHTNPSPEDTVALFHAIEQSFPSATLGADGWYIVAVASLTAGGHPGLAGELYRHLTARGEFATPEQRRALVRRLREALVKLVAVTGVVKPLEAIFCIAEVERPEDRDYSCSRHDWCSGEGNARRGRQWLEQIYRHDHGDTAARLACHRDFEWLSVQITYGLYLSDHSILGPVETELVVLGGILLQNAAREAGWHLRGMRRIGVSAEDVERVQRCVERVAAFCGWTLDKVPRVADVEHEVPWQSAA